MIKVIEKGPEEFIAYCPRCGAKISYELSDVRNIFGTKAFVIDCPECGEAIQHGYDHKNKFGNN